MLVYVCLRYQVGVIEEEVGLFNMREEAGRIFLERKCSPETRGALDELRCSGWISLGLVGGSGGWVCSVT